MSETSEKFPGSTGRAPPLVRLSSSSPFVNYLGPGSQEFGCTARCVDAVIRTADGQARAHRAVLAAGCDLLHGSLLPVEETSSSPEEEAVILMPDFSLAQVQDFLTVLYGRSDRFTSRAVVDVATVLRFRWLSALERVNHQSECGPCVVKLETLKGGGDQPAVQVRPRGKTASTQTRDRKSEKGAHEERRVKQEDSGKFLKLEMKILKSEDLGEEDVLLNNGSAGWGGKEDTHYGDYGDEGGGEREGSDDDLMDEDLVVAEVGKDRRKKRRKKEEDKLGHSLAEKPGRCPRCLLEFGDNLMGHMLTHRDKFEEISGRLVCPDEGCWYSHPERQVVEAHLRWRHDRMYCVYCGTYFSAEDGGLDRHLATAHGPLGSGSIVCYVCSIPYRRADIARHRRTHGEDARAALEEDPIEPGRNSCLKRDCSYSSKDRLEIVNHLAQEHQRPTCPVCLIHMKDEVVSGHHLHSSHGPTVRRQGIVQCKVCTFFFASEAELRQHRKDSTWHEEEAKKQKVVCHQCGNAVISGHLKRHVEKYCRRGEKMKSVYPAKDPRLYIVKRDARGLFCCPHQGGCEGAFQTRVALVHHFCTKHDRRKCPYCFKVFSYLWINEHIAFKHTGETHNVKCPQCPEMFFNKTYVRRHVEAVHVAKPIHTCQFCGKGFTTARACQQHRFEHTRVRRHPCPVCGKIFRSGTLVAPHLQAEHPWFDAKAPQAVLQ